MSWAVFTKRRHLVAEWEQRQKVLAGGELGARSAGAKTANAVLDSRLGSRKISRPRNSIPRTGRSTAPLKGNMAWAASRDLTRTAVGLAASGLKNVPHWKIQEVGTGKSANMRRAARAGVTRDGKSAVEGLRIPSQIGRPVGKRGVASVTLGFGPQPGGKYFAPSSARAGRDSVHALGELGLGGEPIRKIIIRRDIIGKHMVRDSGTQGFQEYQKKVLLAGRDALKGANHKRKGSAKR